MNQTEPTVAASIIRIRVRGLVQGVGFRPTVYRLASEQGLKGEVLNDGDGVLVLLQAQSPEIDHFIHRLRQQCPALARIDAIEFETGSSQTGYRDFSISRSLGTEVHTGIVADAVTCPDCLRDIHDPHNRRSGYAFTNCTHCGPRLSIIKNIPYDRSTTSMANFKLCTNCQQEYSNPTDRRFHAQPNACPDCGPALSLCDKRGNRVLSRDDIATTADLIKQGFILAIKGIGGYQLACDAGNDRAVSALRQRKNRPHKPLAMMAKNAQQVQRYCLVTDTEQAALQSHAGPIVLLDKKETDQSTDNSYLSPHIAPEQTTLGFMLPNSPLHHLLMDLLDNPIVLTSGNISEQPQCIDNDEAIDKLAHIADYFLQHNRDIINRIDDSVLRLMHGKMQVFRRARGYAPASIELDNSLKQDSAILACGGELKNTFCLLSDDQAVLSQHMGNLENVQTYDDYLKNLALYQRLYQFEADAVVVDNHPEYLSSKLGRELANTRNIPLIEVQHHHAHIAACLVDNRWSSEQGPVIGVVLDGLGFGDDGTLWGGEFMLADYHDYQRLGRFKPTAMPGATQAILQPWRNTYAQLKTHTDWNEIRQRFSDLDIIQYLSQKPLQTLDRMIESSTNTPLSSSCGRLFDAVAAALGIQPDQISYEGHAAIQLEAIIQPEQLDTEPAYPFELEHNDMLEINPAALWPVLLQDLAAGISRSQIAARFHKGLAEIIALTVQQIRQQSGINSIALSGGVFQNRQLLLLTSKLLKQQDMNVLKHQQIPANDGGLAIGQAAIAAARLNTGDR